MEKKIKLNRGGRPVKMDKLSVRFRIRMSEYEMAYSRKNALKANLTLAEYFRMVVVNGKVTNLFSEEEQLAKRQLIGMANNLNQLAKEAHTYGMTSVENDAKNILSEMRAILDQYKFKQSNNDSKSNA